MMVSTPLKPPAHSSRAAKAHPSHLLIRDIPALAEFFWAEYEALIISD
jgi:hypothetical protein